MTSITDRDIVVGLRRLNLGLFDRRDGEWSPRATPVEVEGRPLRVLKLSRKQSREEELVEIYREIARVETAMPEVEATWEAWLKSDRKKLSPIDPEHLRRYLERLRSWTL